MSHRRSSDPELLWLWCRPAAAALIGPLAWEPPCAAGVVLKSQRKKMGLLKTYKSVLADKENRNESNKIP